VIEKFSFPKIKDGSSDVYIIATRLVV